jgi:hypothetical protein
MKKDRLTDCRECRHGNYLVAECFGCAVTNKFGDVVCHKNWARIITEKEKLCEPQNLSN